jgi:transcriptional regulator with XRE-family HTH domain
MTQVEFAKMLGTHQASLSQIELGVRGVSLQQIVKLARGLRVSPDRLLGVGKDNGSRPAPRNEKLMRRVRRIEQLPPEQQDAAVKILDGFLDAQRH